MGHLKLKLKTSTNSISDSNLRGSDSAPSLWRDFGLFARGQPERDLEREEAGCERVSTAGQVSPVRGVVARGVAGAVTPGCWTLQLLRPPGVRSATPRTEGETESVRRAQRWTKYDKKKCANIIFYQLLELDARNHFLGKVLTWNLFAGTKLRMKTSQIHLRVIKSCTAINGSNAAMSVILIFFGKLISLGIHPMIRILILNQIWLCIVLSQHQYYSPILFATI